MALLTILSDGKMANQVLLKAKYDTKYDFIFPNNIPLEKVTNIVCTENTYKYKSYDETKTKEKTK